MRRFLPIGLFYVWQKGIKHAASVETLCVWKIMESEYQTVASETLNGFEVTNRIGEGSYYAGNFGSSKIHGKDHPN